VSVAFAGQQAASWRMKGYAGGMRRFLLTCALVLTGMGHATWAAQPAGEEQPIPKQVLDAMDRKELGNLYTPAVAGKLYDAHVLMEKYFAAQQAKDRKAIVAQIKATGIDANILGRLVRIRLYWPELEAGVYYVNERIGPHDVIYFFGVPKGYDRTKAWPMVIKLPGTYAFEVNPPPTAQQVQEWYTGWIQDEMRAHPDAVVMMPLLNISEIWGPSYKGVNSVIQPMLHIGGRANIDPARVYLMGQAMSAHATWNLALHFPTYFAAINPMAGGARLPFQRLRMIGMGNIRAVVWHDAEDQNVKVESSRELVALLKQLKYDVDYEETKGVGHAPDDGLAARLYGKMRAKTRELYPKRVGLASNRPDTLLNRNDWVQVYQMMAPGKEKKARIAYGTGTIMLQENSYSITATMTGPNKIEFTCKNMESLRFHVNDQMVDFSKPVTVTMYGRPKFSGMVQPSVEEMLADQLFLGRGWRYYTGVIDIDFGTAQPETRPTTQPTTRKGTIEYTPPN